MKYMKRLFMAALLLMSAAICASAQGTIRVQAPNMVAADEQFNVTFIIDGEDSPSSFNWSQGNDFKLVWGPQKGSSTSVSIINGKKTRSSQTTFTYVLLPQSTGKFTLPTATATVKGESLSSPRTVIEVVANGANAQSGQRSGQASSGEDRQQSSTGDISSSDLFLRLGLSRTSVVVGEPITVTLKLYQRVNVTGFEDVKFPTFNGFWSQELQAPSNIEFQRENIDDKIFNSALLRSWVLIPQQSGDISIDPAELVCTVNVRVQSNARSVFDSFFDDDIRTIRKRLLTGRQTVHVSPLPAGAPASFGGGVGSFTMSARLSKDSLKTHDAASLLVTVSGRGNVSLLEAPKLSFPPDFEVYDVKVTDSSDKSTGKTSGSKTFEFPFIPRSAGEFVIDPVQYSYYDVNARKYVTLSSDPLPLKVERGSESEPVQGEGQIVAPARGKDVRNLGSDIRFIATKTPSFSRKGTSFCFSGAFWTLLAAIAAAALAAWSLLRGAALRRADVAGERNRGAAKIARKRLSQAGDFLQKNLYTAFYEELHRTLLGYVSDKLNIDMSEMSKGNIAQSLLDAGVPEKTASRFTELLDSCEYARYSPDSGHDAMNAHYETAVDVITSIDASMKKKKNPAAAHTLAVIVLALTMAPTWARASESAADSLWKAGVDSYSRDMWDEALSSWTAIENMGLESAELYYNIGNAYFKLSDWSHSILYYERALKVDPSYKDAGFNLEFASGMIQDRIETVPEFFLVSWVRSAGRVLAPDGWAALFLIFFAVALACAVIFLLSSRTSVRKTGFYCGAAVLLAALICLGFARRQHADALDDSSAIVTKPVTSVRSAPGGGGSKDLFILHEGTKIKILDSVGEWENVELADGRQGWILSSDVDRI